MLSEGGAAAIVIIATLASLINGYCKKQRIDKGMHLFKEVPCRGLNYRTITYNTILHGLFENGRFAAARELFHEMLAKGLIPSLYTCYIFLDGICKNREIVEAFSMFQAMKNDKLCYDVACYNIIIDGTSKGGKIEIARKLLVEVYSNRLQPDVHTYTVCLMKRKSCSEELKNVVNCVQNDVTYNVIVQGFLKGSHCYEALLLMEEMVKRGFLADASTISMLVDIYTCNKRSRFYTP
ncbi:hypothetical protein LguiA_012645 [Lonicera macranthoides]